MFGRCLADEIMPRRTIGLSGKAREQLNIAVGMNCKASWNQQENTDMVFNKEDHVGVFLLVLKEESDAAALVPEEELDAADHRLMLSKTYEHDQL